MSDERFFRDPFLRQWQWIPPANGEGDSVPLSIEKNEPSGTYRVSLNNDRYDLRLDKRVQCLADGQLCVSYWSTPSGLRLSVFLKQEDMDIVACYREGSAQTQAAPAELDLDDFLQGRFQVLARTGSHPQGTITFTKSNNLYHIVNNDEVRAYDQLAFNQATRTLDSIHGWRQVSLWPPESGSGKKRLVGTFNPFQGSEYLLPWEDEDETTVWGAEEGSG